LFYSHNVSNDLYVTSEKWKWKWIYSQVLEVSSRELGVRSDLNLPIAEILDLHDITEVPDTAVDLDLVLKELLEGGDIEDLVARGLRSVDDELFFSSALILLYTASTNILE
jgi:hypothetical protein